MLHSVYKLCVHVFKNVSFLEYICHQKDNDKSEGLNGNYVHGNTMLNRILFDCVLYINCLQKQKIKFALMPASMKLIMIPISMKMDLTPFPMKYVLLVVYKVIHICEFL